MATAFIGMLHFMKINRKSNSALSNLWCFICSVFVILCSIIHLRIEAKPRNNESNIYQPYNELAIATMIIDDLNNRLDAANVLLILPRGDKSNSDAIFNTLKKGIEKRDSFRNIKRTFSAYSYASLSRSNGLK